ncbi:putative metallopeptidase [bacterium]|nr:putative metallopeptidase [bacterium]
MGAQWSIDEGIRERALAIIESFPEEAGHVDVNQVIFVRINGSKAKWLGKCYFIDKTPIALIPKFVVYQLSKFGLLDLSKASTPDGDIFDLKYVIVLNDDAISGSVGELQRVEDATLLHELMHISPCGTKLVKHDLEDFKGLVDKFGAHWDEGIFKDDEEDGMLPPGMYEGWDES